MKSTKAVIPFCLEKRKAIGKTDPSCTSPSCSSCPMRVDLVVSIQDGGFARVIEVSGRKVLLRELFPEI